MKDKPNIHQLAKDAGIHHRTLRTRLDRGWSMEEALKIEVNGIFTKSEVCKEDAQRILDDMPRDMIHPIIAAAIKNYKGGKPGQYARNNHRAVFDQWYGKFINGGDPQAYDRRDAGLSNEVAG